LPSPLTSAEYLRALGLVFQTCRGDKTISEIVRELRGRLSRATVHRLERGAAGVTVSSQMELAAFYGLTLADVHRRAAERAGQVTAGAPGGTFTVTLTRDECLGLLRVWLNDKGRDPH
jgi:hypothetical protein